MMLLPQNYKSQWEGGAMPEHFQVCQVRHCNCVPIVVDLTCIRDAMNKLGGDSNEISIEIFFFYTLGMRHDFKIHFLQVPIDLVIDHFVQFDVAR